MLQPGTVVDRYTVGRLLGSGGMAQVYAVRHQVLGTRHALKVLTRGGFDLRERLIREGRMQARLDPAHVVPVTDVLDVRGAPALLMPYVEGCSLAELLEAHRPGEAEVAALFAGIVAGVASAHEAGIVHRDLKPANVLLEVKRGAVVVRVADFGLGRMDEGGGADTVHGAFMGTPPYCSPEQFADSGSVGPAADLWSLGVVLYELLTGRLPFSGGSFAEVRARVGAGAFDREAVPPGWRALVDGLLDVDPARRLGPAAAVRRRVEAVGPPAELVMGGAVAEVIRAHVEAAEARAAAVAPAPEAQTFAPAAATLAPDLDAAAPTIAPDLVFGDTMAPRDTIEHNLPAERDPFVGREDDLAALRRALGERARLLTVVGMGGAGKTRLVVRYALGALERWPGGVAFCDLAEARSVDGLVAAVARGLDLALTRDDPVARVGHAIAGRGRALVILDNFEQVAASAEPTLGQWLDRAPEAAFVVTSRERLGLAGEVVLPLAPLSPPDSEALFVARAAAATGGFSPSDEDRVAIAALVALLDHLPLAIELAAARARVLSPARLLERMADRFRLLASAGGRRDRQATLRATLDWSWELLSAAERAALAQLAVFEGGFDLESAEAVVDVAELDDAPWTMDLIQALVDKSLVRALGDDRFDLLVSVREYAAARLDAQGARAAAEARHGRWFAGLGAEAALDALERHGGAPRRAALLRERDNLVAANRRAVERGDADLAVPTALAAWVAVAMAAPLAVGVGLLERTLAMPGLADGPRGRLAAAAGFALWSCGRTDEAEARYAQALAAARAAADARTAGRTLRNLGFVHEHRGALDAAADAFRAALAAALAAADRPGEGRTLHALGNLEQLQGERAAARAHLDQALAIHREVGDEQSEAKALGFRGNLEFQEGRLDRAADDYRAAQLLYARLGDRRAAGWVLGNLGVVHAERGELAPAREAFEEALAVHREVGDRRTEGVVLSNLGEISARLGRRAEARALFEAALAVNREVGSRQFEAIALGNLGTLRRHEGDLDGAAQRLREAVALSHEAGDGWTEGELLGELAAVCALRGEFGEGRDALARAVPLLREAGNLAGLGALHVARAELEARAGAPVAARAALDEAEALAAEAGVAPSSRLAQRLAEVRGLVEAARGA